MEDRYFIEWDKDDLDTLRIMKVDVLALGMLTCIRKAFDLIHAHAAAREQTAPWPPCRKNDPDVYDMLCKADAIGVFQVESRAQMNMLPRLQPRKFYDLVVEVAIVRPGPIQGGMVHPYLKRRKPICAKTRICLRLSHARSRTRPGRTAAMSWTRPWACRCSRNRRCGWPSSPPNSRPNEANGLRRAMATFRHVGTIDNFEQKFIDGMIGARL